MADTATLAALRIILGADTGDLDKSLKGAEKTVAQFAKGVENVGKELFNLRNAFVVVTGVAIVGFVKKMTDAGDEVAKTAQKIGITTDSLQELRYAASLSGTKTEDFDAALLQLNKRLGDVNGGVTEAMQTLGKLGFTIDDVKGKGTDEVFKMIADRLPLVKDGMERARIATELYGKAGQQLLPTIMLGSAGLAQMAAEAQKLGLVLGADTLKKAEEANDEFTRIGNALKIAGINIAVGFLPALEAVKKEVTSKEFQDGVKTLGDNFGKLITWMVDHKTEIAQAAAAFSGFRIGAAFGAAFGPAAAGILGVTGGIIGLSLATNALTPEIDKVTHSLKNLNEQRDTLLLQLAGAKRAGDQSLVKSIKVDLDALDGSIDQATIKLEALRAAAAKPAPTQITITKGMGELPEQNFPQVDEAISNLSLKTRILRGDFDNLAPGFIEMANGLKVFGDQMLPNAMTAAQLSTQLQALNLQLLAFKGAQLTQEVMPAWQAYEQQIQKIQMLFDAGVISAETYQRAMRDASVKSGAAWDVAGASIAGSFATIAGSFGKSNSAMATAAKVFGGIQATISMFTGMAKALELPFPANIAAVAQVAAQGASFIASIKSQSVPKFATGGSFRVAGAGALDSQRVAMDLNPGEIVDVRAPQYGESGGGASVVTVPLILQGENFTRGYLEKMIEALNGMAGDGYRLQVAPA